MVEVAGVGEVKAQAVALDYFSWITNPPSLLISERKLDGTMAE